ncbi:MAG: NUDIX hydrolase [Firmicutes bacterium]|nr:NUDIX hydrolase [Bacillota bacterium]
MNRAIDEKEAKALAEVTTGSEEVFRGTLLDVFRDTVRLPNGSAAHREYIKHVGAVAIIPLTDDGKVYIERQYRYPVDEVITEIPAGKLNDRSEDRLEAAKRELEEETGLTADRWDFIGDVYVTAAYSDEVISIYLARGLHKGEARPDEDEFLIARPVPLEELLDKIYAGEIPDAKTQIGLLKLARYLDTENGGTNG